MERKQYPLRVDPELWQAVQRWANDDFRSVNAQVEWILRDALRRAGRYPRRAGEPDAPAEDTARASDGGLGESEHPDGETGDGATGGGAMGDGVRDGVAGDGARDGK